jgi:ketosteroid isomerase-like protein
VLPEQRLEVTRQALEAVDQGDWSAIVPHLAPDVVFDNTRSRGPRPGVFQGPDELRRFWELMTGVWESVTVDLGDLTTVGELIVVPRTFRARGRGGIEVTAQSTWLVRFDGDKIAWLCMYQEHDEAIEAAQALDRG